MDWAEFFAMGSYGFYVWSSYGLAAIVLALNAVLPLRRRTSLRRQLAGFYRLHRNRNETSS